jgi:hypothetical protein
VGHTAWTVVDTDVDVAVAVAAVVAAGVGVTVLAGTGAVVAVLASTLAGVNAFTSTLAGTVGTGVFGNVGGNDDGSVGADDVDDAAADDGIVVPDDAALTYDAATVPVSPVPVLRACHQFLPATCVTNNRAPLAYDICSGFNALYANDVTINVSFGNATIAAVAAPALLVVTPVVVEPFVASDGVTLDGAR